MLYDPKWEQTGETKADPFKLGSLIAWLEKQPTEQTYNYENCQGACLLCQYLTAQGENWLDYSRFEDFSIRRGVAGIAPFTFGAALDRAREFVAAR